MKTFRRRVSGDNLHSLRELASESVDVIYADPPFNSNRRYNMTVQGDMAQEEAYPDTWTWNDVAKRTYAELRATATTGPSRDVAIYLEQIRESIFRMSRGSKLFAYLVMMSVRILEVHRVLKPTGALYLHCDPTACRDIGKVLDFVFGPENFRSQIVWQRTSAHNKVRKYGPNQDIILFYTKSDKYTWNVVYHPAPEEVPYVGIDEDGRRWDTGCLTGDGTCGGDSGQPWYSKKRGVTVDPGAIGRHWAISKGSWQEWKNRMGRELEGTSQEKLDQLDELDLLYWSRNNVPRYKKYLDIVTGAPPLQEIWTDIPPLSPKSDEWVDFDTQKPVALVERFIKASSNEGEVVLDPFMGSGTTAIAAGRLNRSFIGFELTTAISDIAVRRAEKEFGEGCFDEETIIPATREDAKKLADDPKDVLHYQFQCWICRLLRAHPGPKGRGPDGTLVVTGFKDGQSKLGIVEVKSGGANPKDVSDLVTRMQSENAIVGLFVCFRGEVTQGMKDIAYNQGIFKSGFPDDEREFDKVQILCVEDAFDRRIDLLDAKLPGTVKRPDYTKIREEALRERHALAEKSRRREEKQRSDEADAVVQAHWFDSFKITLEDAEDALKANEEPKDGDPTS